jgi:hypothetical protein
MRPPIALLAALATLLFLLAGACTSSADNGQIEPDWQRFTVVLDDGYPYSVDSIEEMERVGGFPFIFPSYLPQGMDDKIMVGASASPRFGINGVEYTLGPVERFTVCRGSLNAPYVTIEERQPPFPEDFPESAIGNDEITIGEASVVCDVRTPLDALNPVLQCDWLAQDRGFHAAFQWTVGSPIPGYITEEMREEGLKVIRSIIEAPVQLESAEAE